MEFMQTYSLNSNNNIFDLIEFSFQHQQILVQELKMFLEINDSQDVVPRAAASPSPGDLLQMEITVLHTDLWNQEF